MPVGWRGQDWLKYCEYFRIASETYLKATSLLTSRKFRKVVRRL